MLRFMSFVCTYIIGGVVWERELASFRLEVWHTPWRSQRSGQSQINRVSWWEHSSSHIWCSVIHTKWPTERLHHSNALHQQGTRFKYSFCVLAVCCASMVYIVSGLIVFAVGLFWRTGTFVALLGPLTCLFVVLTASEYYHLKRSKRCRRWVWHEPSRIVYMIVLG